VNREAQNLQRRAKHASGMTGKQWRKWLKAQRKAARGTTHGLWAVVPNTGAHHG